MSEERLHHPYSPSSLQNLEACPCFQNRDSNNAAAVAGTLAHSVTETGEDDQRLSDDEALRAADCLDFYERQKQLLEDERNREVKRICESLQGPEDAVINPEWAACEVPTVIDLCEAYLPVDNCVFHEPMLNPASGEIEMATIEATTAGYVDRALINWNRKRAVLLDWKFGAWAVEEAQTNLQAIAYTLGIFKKYPTLEEVKFFFKLPQLDLVTEATFTRAQIPNLYLRVQTVVERARVAREKVRGDDFLFATPRVPACNFCANLGRCPKVAEFACKVGAKFHPLEIPSDITPTGLKSPEDTTLGLRLSQVMAVWAKAFRAQVTERVIGKGDEPPPGFKIMTRADREIVDTKKFRDVTLKYVTSDELMALATYTFGNVEDKIKEAAPRGTKKQTLEEYQQALFKSGAVKKGESYSFLKGVSEK